MRKLRVLAPMRGHRLGAQRSRTPIWRRPMFLLEDSDIVIEDVVALRYHAWLATTPIGTEIHDAYSSNGTSVNGTRGLCAPLTEGDVVTIGTSTWLSPTASWSG